jgi:hypothetical protein
MLCYLFSLQNIKIVLYLKKTLATIPRYATQRRVTKICEFLGEFAIMRKYDLTR